MNALNSERNTTYEVYRNNADDLLRLFTSNLADIQPEIVETIDFSHEVQKNNLKNFINDALDSIKDYESIYPFVKNLCSGQNIDPGMYQYVERVLKFVLDKGKGSGELFDLEIKDAWITYCALLSYSMIDEPPRNVQVRPGKNKRSKSSDSEHIIAQLS